MLNGGESKLAILEDDVSTFQKLGLTRNQSKVYLSLAANGEENFSVGQVSKCCGVPRERIYKITSQLEEKGLISKILSNPTKFSAIPVKTCISILLQQQQNEYKELVKKSRMLAQKFLEKKTTPTIEEQKIVLLPKGKTKTDTIKCAIKALKQVLDCITTWDRFQQLVTFLDESLNELQQNDVKFRFIVNKPTGKQPPSSPLTNWLPNVMKIKYLPSTPKACVALFDKKEVFILTHPKRCLSDSPLLKSNNKSLVSVIQDYFEILWITSMEKPSIQLDADLGPAD